MRKRNRLFSWLHRRDEPKQAKDARREEDNQEAKDPNQGLGAYDQEKKETGAVGSPASREEGGGEGGSDGTELSVRGRGEPSSTTRGIKQDAEDKTPTPAKPSVDDRAPLPIHQEVWNKAYEAIVKDDPKLVESYLKALKASLQSEGTSDSIDPDVSAEMNDPAKREETMTKLVESGRKKVEKSAKATERLGEFANGVLQCKAAVDLAVQNIPQAALPWAGVCIGLQVSMK